MFRAFLFVCAAAAAAASPHAGVECLEHQKRGVVEPETGCPLHLCPPYPHCRIWGVGTFAAPPVSAPPLPPPRGCSNGVGSLKNLEWVSNCGTPFLSPADLRASLAGSSLLIQFDSLLRHVFLRLVAHVRDEPTVIDPWFHEDALYSFNETHDRLTLQGLTGGLRLVNSPTFVAAFQWDPTVKAVPRPPPFSPQWTLRVSAPINRGCGKQKIRETKGARIGRGTSQCARTEYNSATLRRQQEAWRCAFAANVCMRTSDIQTMEATTE